MAKLFEIEKKEHGLKEYFRKMKGSQKRVYHVNMRDALIGAFGGFMSIFLLLLLTNATGTEWMITTFGGSCLLIFGIWQSPVSQPKNIIGGHLIATFIGIVVHILLGSTPFSISVAVGLTIFAMLLTQLIHPPAVGNPIIVVVGGYGWSFLLSPVLIGSVFIVLLGVLINNLSRNRHYPLFW